MSKKPLIACTVSCLAGDSMMMLPRLRQLCDSYSIKMVCGSYSKPVWEFALECIDGMDFEIIEVMDDPDEGANPLCPGWGYPAMENAMAIVREKYSGKEISGTIKSVPDSIRLFACYEAMPYDIKVKDGLLREDDHIVVQPYTKHEWKNCDDVVFGVHFKSKVYSFGFSGEQKGGFTYLHDMSFTDCMKKFLSAKGIVSVLSIGSCAAAVFKKNHIAVCYTLSLPDLTKHNPNGINLLTPTDGELQEEIDKRGW